MRHIKGFVDILVLASGYQSSGLPATWDADNIKKALRWGIFFEEVFKGLRGSVDYEDSMAELDAALFDLTSDSNFPQGLANMSSSNISRARELILGYLFQSHPIRDAHLVSLLTAIIEMDIDDLTETDNGSTKIYLDKLMLQIESLNLLPEGNGFVKGSSTSSLAFGSGTPLGLKCRVHNPISAVPSYTKPDEYTFVGYSCFIFQELSKRQETISCISSLEAGLDAVLKSFARNHVIGDETNPSKGQSSDASSSKNEMMLTELLLWNHWRSKCLSYMLNKRTIRMLSGANLIFSAPKAQYFRILEPLRGPIDANNDNFLETMEISLLAFISRRWNFLVEYFMSHSFDCFSISKLYSNLHHLLQRPQSFLPEKETLDEKEKDILEYVTPLMATQPHILWKLPPILVAAFPSWSVLFRIYLTEMERQFSGSSSIRCCDCSEAGREHKDCEVAERVRCLSMFHGGSYLLSDDVIA